MDDISAFASAPFPRSSTICPSAVGILILCVGNTNIVVGRVVTVVVVVVEGVVETIVEVVVELVVELVV